MSTNQFMFVLKKVNLKAKQNFIINGTISEIKIASVKGRQALLGKDLKNFEIFLGKYAEEIVEKWVNYFIYHKKVQYRLKKYQKD